MWQVWNRAKATYSRPSQLLEIEDSLAAYMLDGALVTFGTIMENALTETVEIGVGATKQTRLRYTLRQLLDPEFTLPRENEPIRASSKMLGTSDGGMMVDTV